MQIIFKDIDEIKDSVEGSVYANSKTHTLEGVGISIHIDNMWHSNYVFNNGVEVMKKIKSKLREE
jgi:hypothetical protein